MTASESRTVTAHGIFNINRFRIPEEEHKYWLVYHINGVMAIVLEWIKWDCKEPVEDVAEIIENCVRTKNAVGIEEPSI